MWPRHVAQVEFSLSSGGKPRLPVFDRSGLAASALARFFSRGRQIMGLGTKVTQRGLGMERWGQRFQKSTTGCENNA